MDLPLSIPAATSATSRLRSLLRQLAPDDVAVRQRVYSTPFYLLGNDRTLFWQDCPHVGAVGELHCQLDRFPLFLAADNLQALEPRLMGFESFVASEACTVLVEHALAPILDLIECLAARPVTCETFRRLSRSSAPAGDGELIRLGFVLSSPHGEPEVRGWLRAPLAAWHSLDFSRASTSALTRYRAVPLTLKARLGRCSLPVTELRQLQVGDALRMTPRAHPGGQGLSVWLHHAAGRFGARASLAADELTLETLMSMTTMTTTPPALPPALEKEFLNGAECELTFELGSSLCMSLEEIGKLRVGQALRLGVHLQEQPVRILTGGREIARGELAAVGDELVVVVTETGGLPQR